MQSIKISGKSRTETGGRAAKAVRAEGNVPCVLYGGSENINFSTTQKELRGIIYTPNFYKAELNIDGKTVFALLKDYQADPISGDVIHVDFQELVPGARIFVDIPVKTEGIAVGVKEGGKLLVKVRKLHVRATAETLKDMIKIDVSALKLGQSIKVKDIKAQGFEIMNSPSIPVASIEIPRSLRSATAGKEEPAK